MNAEAFNTEQWLAHKSIFLKERPEPPPVTTGFEADSFL